MDLEPVLYNEIDPFAAQWLRNLSAAGHIAKGEVDARSIKELARADVAGRTQAHFFAGLGGWSHALWLAGWPVERPVWTGSCPCQPFSAAGKRGGVADPRHLWPDWFKLIQQCRPPVIFGEQVASADGLKWLDAVSTDLEREGYAFGAADLCAAGVGAPHLRQRLYFVAYAVPAGRAERGACAGGGSPSGGSGFSYVADSEEQRQHRPGVGRFTNDSVTGSVADPNKPEPGDSELQRGGRLLQPPQNTVTGFWNAADWIPCSDGKARPVEPGTFPLAHGISGRVGRLRAYGNAIVPQVAAAFVRSVMGIL